MLRALLLFEMEKFSVNGNFLHFYFDVVLTSLCRGSPAALFSRD